LVEPKICSIMETPQKNKNAFVFTDCLCSLATDITLFTRLALTLILFLFLSGPASVACNWLQNVTFFKLDFIFNIPFTLWCCFTIDEVILIWVISSDSIAFIYFLLFGNYFFLVVTCFIIILRNHYGLVDQMKTIECAV
jgi:hypothetical protein